MNINELNIFKDILNKNITLKELSKNYNVSERQIRNYIDNISDTLKKIKAGTLKIDKYILFDNHINIEEDELLDKIAPYIEMDKNERHSLIELNLIFSNKLNITKIAKELNVSRLTIKKDFEIIKEKLQKKSIEVIYDNKHGFNLKADSKDILIYSIEYLKDVYNSSHTIYFKKQFENIFTEEDINKAKLLLKNISNITALNISNDGYSSILYYIVLIIKSDSCKNLQIINQISYIQNKEFYEIDEIFLKIYPSFINKDRKDIVNMIADLSFGLSIDKNHNSMFDKWIDESLIVRHIIKDFSTKIGINLSNDPLLYKSLMFHLKPAIYRAKNNIDLNDNIYQSIDIDNDEVKNVVKEVIGFVEKDYDFEFRDIEISLLSYHFITAIDRSNTKKIKKVILICGLGYGSSRILEHNLKDKYNIKIVSILSVQELDKLNIQNDEADLIISTVDIEDIDISIPIIKINPLISTNDDAIKLAKHGIHPINNKVEVEKLIDLIKTVNSDINEDKIKKMLLDNFNNIFIQNESRKYKHILKYLGNKIMIVDNVANYEDAITIVGNMLCNNKSIKKSYITDMISNIKKMGAYIVIENGIAMPHSDNKDNILKTDLSILLVREKVYFTDDKYANIFFCFSSINKTEHIPIINELLDLLNENNFLEEILKLDTSEKILEYIRSKGEEYVS